MGDKAQQYKDAAQALGKQPLVNAFGATAGTGPVAFENESSFLGFSGSGEEDFVKNQLVRTTKSMQVTNAVSTGDQIGNLEDEEKEKSERDWKTFLTMQAVQQAIEDNLKAIQEQVKRYSKMAEEYDALAGRANAAAKKVEAIIDRNMTFIDRVDDVLEKYKKDKKLDRDAAFFALKERGINVKSGVSDENLLLILKSQQAADIEEYPELNRLQGELINQEADYKLKEKQARVDAQDVDAKRNKIDSSNEPPEIKKEQSEELKNKTENTLLYEEADLSKKQKRQQEIDEEIKKKFSQKVTVGAGDLFEDEEPASASSSSSDTNNLKENLQEKFPEKAIKPSPISGPGIGN